jgi:SPOR domain
MHRLPNRTETMAVPEDLPDLDVQGFRLWWERGAPSKATHGRSRVWKMIATMLMFVGLISIAVLALRGSSSRALKGLPVVAPIGVPAAGESRDGETTTASDDFAPLSKESSQSTQLVKDQSAEPKTQASLGLPPEVKAVPKASQSADTKPVRTVTLRPDGATTASPVSIESSPPAHAPNQPAGYGPVAMKDTVRIEQPVKTDSMTKHFPATAPSQIVVVRREATGDAMAADSREQFLPEPPVKPNGAATDPKSPRAATDPILASEAPGEAARQSFNRVLHTIGGLIGQKNPPAAQSDSVFAPAGWGVQLAAPRSETEAKSDVRRLSAQYASTLKGTKIGVHKAVVDGVTVFRLRVVDLSKADASALCARLKDDGGSCFLAR